MKKPVLISACLIGIKSRYDGNDALSRELVERDDIIKIPICPEQLGGFPTPRPPCEIRWKSSVGEASTHGNADKPATNALPPDGLDVLDGRAGVFTLEGDTVTEGFLKGAREGLRAAVASGAKTAILKEKSPSCGVNYTVSNGEIVRGRGVLSALLQIEGIEVKGL